MMPAVAASGRAALSQPERRALLDEVWRQRCLLCVHGLALVHVETARAVCGVGKRFPACVGAPGGFELREGGV